MRDPVTSIETRVNHHDPLTYETGSREPRDRHRRYPS
ncbi:MAG: hypothetical protein K0S14_2175 [Thermomicrobiales bacterium]|jgi:hypothetical protein|nr:hypothetical protein [Thermomicrobiales bacterium]MCD6058130.1 hypothetical protein [Thermomicrobiales bacterium]MDF2758598.1 hypothetical protein [Thermomicrobiales bacterium]MDF3017770.1 hypothetical protein [Thermomicrobiales bacterium]